MALPCSLQHARKRLEVHRIGCRAHAETLSFTMPQVLSPALQARHTQLATNFAAHYGSLAAELTGTYGICSDVGLDRASLGSSIAGHEGLLARRWTGVDATAETAQCSSGTRRRQQQQQHTTTRPKSSTRVYDGGPASSRRCMGRLTAAIVPDQVRSKRLNVAQGQQ